VKFVIITHTQHKLHHGILYGYGPYIREMNLWGKYVDELTIVAPLLKRDLTKIDLPYHHANIRLKRIPSLSLTSFGQIIKSIFLAPAIFYVIMREISKADHIHLRCPGNIGLIGCIAQIFFKRKIKTTKYAGNWDPNAQQPLSYRIQKWLLSNTFLTRNMQVLVYGNWGGQTKNIKPFFTATYPKSRIGDTIIREFGQDFKFLFVGSLSAGKRPLYVIQLIEALLEKGVYCSLDIYGEGIERNILENYIDEKSLSDSIKLFGNQPSEEVENALRNSQFLILPSKSEGWPKVVAEAMFWGVIPIVTRVSCVPWMLDHGNRGILLDYKFNNDVVHIFNKIQQLKTLKMMSKKCMEWSHKFTLDDFEDEIKKLLK